jgi:hypothetical protein
MYVAGRCAPDSARHPRRQRAWAFPTSINTAAISARMTAMDTHNRCDELTTGDAPIPGESANSDETARQRRCDAAAKLDQIAQQVNRALTEQGIKVDLFFVISSGGNGILAFGTAADPPDDQWIKVCEIVSSIVRHTIGVEWTRCQGLLSAMTATPSTT